MLYVDNHSELKWWGIPTGGGGGVFQKETEYYTIFLSNFQFSFPFLYTWKILVLPQLFWFTLFQISHHSNIDQGFKY